MRFKYFVSVFIPLLNFCNFSCIFCVRIRIVLAFCRVSTLPFHSFLFQLKRKDEAITFLYIPIFPSLSYNFPIFSYIYLLRFTKFPFFFEITWPELYVVLWILEIPHRFMKLKPQNLNEWNVLTEKYLSRFWLLKIHYYIILFYFTFGHIRTVWLSQLAYS